MMIAPRIVFKMGFMTERNRDGASTRRKFLVGT